MLTESEKTFEEFCRDKGIPFEKIQGEENKTPDYYITLSDTKIVVEIKQFGS